MRCFLVDNGSLRIESWRNLCELAAAVSHRVGVPVEPASVLHSSRIDPASVPAGVPKPTTWERAVKAALAEGEDTFWTLPFFIGPSGAVTEYLPQREAAIRERVGPLQVHYGPFLADPMETEAPELPDLLEDRIEATRLAHGLERPPVILVDHGSPRPEVTAVRDRMAVELSARLADRGLSVQPASMERRNGPEYDFNEPLIEQVLGTPPFDSGDVIVAQLFLSPGRHAGEDGDIARICRTASAARPGLRTWRTGLLGNHPEMPALVAARFRALMQRAERAG